LAWPGTPSCPETLVTFTIAPPLAVLRMRRTAALVQWNAPVRFTLRTRAHSSGFMRTNKLSHIAPALLTK